MNIGGTPHDVESTASRAAHPGRGIGPEVTEAAVRLVEASGVQVAWERVEAGAEVVAKYGTPVPDSGHRHL